MAPAASAILIAAHFITMGRFAGDDDALESPMTLQAHLNDEDERRTPIDEDISRDDNNHHECLDDSVNFGRKHDCIIGRLYWLDIFHAGNTRYGHASCLLSNVHFYVIDAALHSFSRFN